MAFKAVQSIMSGKMVKGMGIGSAISIGTNAYFGMDTYNTAREEGSGKLGAAGKAVGEMVMMDAMGLPAYLGFQALTAAPKAGLKVYETLNQSARQMSGLSRNSPFYNSKFQDSQQAYTMRQAGMQLAKASKYNMQQTMLGNEAAFLHY